MIHDKKADFCAFSQPRNFDTPNFLELFKAKVSVVENFGGFIGNYPVLI